MATIGDNFEGSKFEKFSNGLTNKRIDDTTSKAYDIYNNKDLSKVDKLNKYTKLISDYRAEEKKNRPINAKPTLSLVNPVSNVSNGHVPSGYQTSTSPEGSGYQQSEFKSIVPSGASSILVEKQQNNPKQNNKKKQKQNNKKKQKQKQTKAKKVWNDWKKKQNNKKKTKQNKHK